MIGQISVSRQINQLFWRRTYFDKKALKEWHGLDNSIREQLKKKLEKRLEHPHIKKDKLSGSNDIYKIKLRNSGYRLAYLVDDKLNRIIVIIIGKRDKDLVYKELRRRWGL
ncbi:MAG: type II toxin-antitoxin system RelE/ParE family toxin [candidate division WOR-3 bacterium]|nr:type II toxin-antitoxin system RelE/ParE family toxin [candidate division WOR-3 bacterium]